MKKDKLPGREVVLGLLLSTVVILASLLLYTAADRRIKKENPRIFGATYMTMNNPYFTALNESIREVVESRGDVLLTRDPAQNQERQNQQILDMIDEGIEVLFANPVDWKNIQPALEACREAGVAVFVVDTAVADTDSVVSVIQSDQYHAGELVAQDMMHKMPEGCSIITLTHYNVHSTVERLEGFLETIKYDSRYRVVAGTDRASEIETANEIMAEMLRDYPNVDVVFGNNDPSAIGAVAAISTYREEHPGYDKEILVYGVDGSPDAKNLIARGEMVGTAAQYPILMGHRAATIAYEYLEGKQVKKEYIIGVSMMNKANLSQNDISGWQ